MEDPEAEAELEADREAEAALRECAIAARLHPWTLTFNELRALYGYTASGLDPPFITLSPLQLRRVRAWHAATPMPLATRVRLAAAFVFSAQIQPSAEGQTLRAIALRAVPWSAPRRGQWSSETRAHAAEVASLWTGRGEEVLRLLTSRHVVHAPVYRAFDAELQRVLESAGRGATAAGPG